MSITRKWTTYLLLIAATLVLMFPILYAFSISFMSGAEVLEGKIWPSSFSLENYRDAFEKVPLLHYLINSFAVSIFVMAGQLLVSSLAAFAFVFIKFKGRDAIFFLFISTMMIPWEATMVPNFLTAQKLGWINNYLGLTIPFFALAFGTFLLRQQYLWPLLVTNTEDVRTVQIGLKQMQTQEISTDWGVVMAAVVVVILPTLLLLFLGQKRLQKGLTQGAIK
jgi:sn-glycerol 3-phosphate transport system permease protein